MPAAQKLLFADPKPLVERLGRDFFAHAPEAPGVYRMCDDAGVVLYVGKARNLRKRLRSYRVANPDRMPRRHLRLLRAVARIEMELCADEASALDREAELLRTLKPRFNRAGTWSAPARYLACRRERDAVVLAVTKTPEPDWWVTRPLGAGAGMLRIVLVRLLWLAVNPQTGMASLPAGWFHGHLGTETLLPCGSATDHAAVALKQLFSGEVETFCAWITGRLSANLNCFERSLVDADTETLMDAAAGFRSEKLPESSLPGSSRRR